MHCGLHVNKMQTASYARRPGLTHLKPTPSPRTTCPATELKRSQFSSCLREQNRYAQNGTLISETIPKAGLLDRISYSSRFLRFCLPEQDRYILGRSRTEHTTKVAESNQDLWISNAQVVIKCLVVVICIQVQRFVESIALTPCAKQGIRMV